MSGKQPSGLPDRTQASANFLPGFPLPLPPNLLGSASHAALAHDAQRLLQLSAFPGIPHRTDSLRPSPVDTLDYRQLESARKRPSMLAPMQHSLSFPITGRSFPAIAGISDPHAIPSSPNKSLEAATIQAGRALIAGGVTAYTPQVENISPTPDDDSNAADQQTVEITQRLDNIDKEINEVSAKLSRLKKKEVNLLMLINMIFFLINL